MTYNTQFLFGVDRRKNLTLRAEIDAQIENLRSWQDYLTVLDTLQSSRQTTEMLCEVSELLGQHYATALQ